MVAVVNNKPQKSGGYLSMRWVQAWIYFRRFRFYAPEI
ncbi:hypothetical protein BN135_446 [Cronobacter muytjensii 530]